MTFVCFPSSGCGSTGVGRRGRHLGDRCDGGEQLVHLQPLYSGRDTVYGMDRRGKRAGVPPFLLSCRQRPYSPLTSGGGGAAPNPYRMQPHTVLGWIMARLLQLQWRVRRLQQCTCCCHRLLVPFFFAFLFVHVLVVRAMLAHQSILSTIYSGNVYNVLMNINGASLPASLLVRVCIMTAGLD